MGPRSPGRLLNLSAIQSTRAMRSSRLPSTSSPFPLIPSEAFLQRHVSTCPFGYNNTFLRLFTRFLRICCYFFRASPMWELVGWA